MTRQLGEWSTWWVALAALTMANLLPSSARAQPTADTIEQAEKCLVRIEMEGSDGKGIGSGFIVDSRGILITNAHVLGGSSKATAAFPNGRKYPIFATRLIDHARDICIAKIEGNDFPYLTLRTTPPRKGESVTALGSPLGLSFTATRGIVSAVRSAEEMRREAGKGKAEGTWIQVDAALSGGNSGGPLINDDGEVVAMSTLASSGRAQNLNFGICAVDIREALRRTESLPWEPLSTGAAKSRSPDEEFEKDKLISHEAVLNYVASVRKEFNNYQKDMLSLVMKTKEDIRDIKIGSTRLPPDANLMSMGLPTQVVVKSVTNAKSGKRFYFASDSAKARELARTEQALNELNDDVEKVRGKDRNEAMLALLQHVGPPLATRREGTVGLMKDAIVLATASEELVLIRLDGSFYLLLAESTTGLYPGQPLERMPVAVGGVVPPPPGTPLTTNVTLLAEVPDKQMKRAVYTDVSETSKDPKQASSSTGGPNDHPLFSQPSPTAKSPSQPTTNSSGDGYREWTDKSGVHTIKAKLINVAEGKVTLRKQDGSVIHLAVDKFCEADQRYLKGQ
jgi:hypothetical protein